MNIINRLIAGVLISLVIVLEIDSQCPSFSNTTISPAKCQSACTLCVDDFITISSQGVNLPDGSNVNWYIDENTGFDPYFGDGTFIGSSLISTPSTPCTPTPFLIGLMIDACGPEAFNEFLVIDAGGGFNTDDIIVDFAPQNNGGPGNDDLGIGFPCELTNGDPSLVGGCDNVQSIGPGQDLPPGSIIVIFTSQGASNVYDMSGLCGHCRDIYVMSSTCSRSKGAFSNHTSTGIRTQTWSVGCSGGSVVYDCAALSGDGDQWIGGVVNGTCDFQGAAVPFNLPSTVSDFSIAVPQDWCEMDLELVGIVDPLDLPDCCTEPYTMRYNFHIACPEALESEMSLCDNGSGQAEFDLNILLTMVLNGSSGTVRWFTDFGLTNEIFPPYTTASTTIYAVIQDGDCLSEPVEITLNVLPLPEINDASLEECETAPNSGIAIFDLDNIVPLINNGSGNEVKFFLNPDKTGLIVDRPYLSASGVIYAATNNGECESLTEAIVLTVYPKPFAFPAKLKACEDPPGSEMAVFILEDADDDIKGGVGSWNVKYYEDIDLSFEISSPFLSESTIVYAVVENENCTSEPVEVELEVFKSFDSKPVHIRRCSEHPDSTNATFSAQFFYDIINGGEAFDIFADSMGTILLKLPYIGGDTIIFGRFENDSCSVGLFKIHVRIGDPPVAMSYSDTICMDSNGLALFDLDRIALNVKKDSTLKVDFSKDSTFINLLNGIYQSEGDTLLARVNGNGCFSELVQIILVATSVPMIDQINDLSGCDSIVLPIITGTNITAQAAYYTMPNANGIKYNAGDVIYQSQSLYIFDQNINCSVELDFNIEITKSANAGDDQTISVCSGAQIVLKTIINGDDHGQFFDIDQSNSLKNDTFTTTGLMGTYRFKYLINADEPCSNDSSLITVNIVDEVTAGNDLLVRLCRNDSINLIPLLGNADPGGIFLDLDMSGGLNSGSSIFNGTFTTVGNWRILYIVGDNKTCPSDTAILTIEVLEAIDIDEINIIQACDFYILPKITGTNLTGNEAYYELSKGNGLVYQAGDTIRQNIELFIYDSSPNICPDEETINIVIGKTTTNIIKGSLCPGNSLTFNGTVYDEDNPSGSEILSNANSSGCDSILRIDLSFYDESVFDLFWTLCRGDSILINGTVYNESNPMGTEILQNGSINGCDSIINIDLDFSKFAIGIDNRTICLEDTVVINGTLYHINNPSGSDTLRGASQNGCDSISSVEIDFYNSVNNISQTLCYDEILTVGMHTFDVNNPSGQVVLENGSVNGCDSIINVDLTFFNEAINLYRGELCVGNNITINGKIYDINNPSGKDTLMNATINGCDSILDIAFTFEDAVSSTLILDLCHNDSITINGTVYNNSNLQGDDTLKNASSQGCDSIVSVQINILQSRINDMNINLCKNESIIINGVEYNERRASGTEVLQNSATNGCDSIINIQLLFEDYFIDPTNEVYEIIRGDSVQLSFTTDINYTNISWNNTEGLSCIDCLELLASPSQTTTYIITLTDNNGCEVSAKIRIIVKEGNTIYVPNSFTPNGDGINDYFRVFTGENTSQLSSFRIYNRWGEVIYLETNTDITDSKSHIGWDGKYNSKEMNPGVYVYLISLVGADDKEMILKGTLTLIK